MRHALLALAALLAGPVPTDAKLRLSGGPKAEDRLRRFVAGDPVLRDRLADAARREEAFRAEARDGELRDAVSDLPLRREELIEQLPGMKLPPSPTCPTLRECASPELAADVPDAERLPDAVRRLVRPWMLLQQARGSVAELSPASEGDAILSVRLRGLDAEPIILNVSPRLLGGFKVWFDRPLLLAALYGRERDALLED